MDDQNASFHQIRSQGPLPEPPPPSGPNRVPPRRWVLVVVLGALMVAAIATVIALLPKDDGRQTAEAGSTAPSEAADPAPAMPGDVQGDADAFRVVLSWSVDDSAGPVEGFRIYRDGNLIETALPTVSSYVDPTVAPSTRYSYRIEAFGAGLLASEPVLLHVRTRGASPKDAPIEGTFDVQLHLTSSQGVNGLKDHTAGWRFSPECESDPCVRLIDIHHDLPPLELRRLGDGYVIKDSGHLDLYCSGSPMNVSYRLEFRVTKAGVIDDEWRGRRIEGTFTERASSQLGCASGEASYRFTGTLVERGQ